MPLCPRSSLEVVDTVAADFEIRGEATLGTEGLQAGLSQLQSLTGNVLAGVTKAAAAALAAAGAAVTAIAKQALDSFAVHEQAVGGVKTLFGTEAESVEEYAKSVGKSVDEVSGEYNSLIAAQNAVLTNAENAYKTAGLSANDYMNTVTSFAASLVSSLGGDTVRAAELADMAITDMADNANKMGSNMEDIQNAYQGFAKQNYTMLDNLKLGYGGTQAEMQRLLADAEALSGVHFELGNYADMVQAIHVIQENMGITGTTAQEAAETIEGSVNSAKAAWANLLTGFADESADLPVLVENLTEALAVAAGNVLPRLVKIFEGLGEALTEAAPAIAAQVPPMIESLLPSFLSAAASLAASIAAQLPDILGAVAEAAAQVMADTGAQAAYSLITGFAGDIPGLITEGMSALASLADYLTANMDVVFDVGLQLLSSIVEGIRNGLPDLLFAAARLVTSFGVEILDHADEILEAGKNIVFALIEGIANLVADFGEAALGLIARFLHIWDGNMSQFGQIGTNAVQSIINGILGKKTDAQNAAADVYNAVQAGFSGMGGGRSSGGGAGRGGANRAAVQAVEPVEPVAIRSASAVSGLSSALDKLSTSGSKAAKQTETLADKLEKADKALTESRNAYKTLSDAAEEYNETGSISLATWQDLMGLAPEYQALLVKEGERLAVNTAAYNELTAAQRLEIETLAQANGVLPETIRLIDGLGIAADEAADKTGTAFSELKEKLDGLTESGPLAVIGSLADALRSGDWSGAAQAVAEGLWLTITPDQQDAITSWAVQAVQAMNDGFTTDGWAGLINAGSAIVQGLAEGITSGQGVFVEAVQGLLSTFSGLGDSVLPAVGNAVMSLLGALNTLVPGIDLASAATAIFNAILDANPIILIISLIGMLASALYGFAQTNTKAGEMIRGVWDGIVDVVKGALRFILGMIEAVFEAAFAAWNLFVKVAGKYLGLSEIHFDFTSWLDGSDENTDALEENTEALEEQTELLRNPPSYRDSGSGPAGGVTDYSAMLAAARAEVLRQNTQVATNYDAGGGTTQARLNASWRGTSTTILELDGREVAKATKDYMDEELAF